LSFFVCPAGVVGWEIHVGTGTPPRNIGMETALSGT
jgi:hypothetical protein